MKIKMWDGSAIVLDNTSVDRLFMRQFTLSSAGPNTARYLPSSVFSATSPSLEELIGGRKLPLELPGRAVRTIASFASTVLEEAMLSSYHNNNGDDVIFVNGCSCQFCFFPLQVVLYYLQPPPMPPKKAASSTTTKR